MEEMGFETSLQKIFNFTYKSEFDNGLIEYEFDHVFTGVYDGSIIPNKEEVNGYCYKSLEEIKYLLQKDGKKFTSWFHIAFPMVEKWMKNI